MAFSFQMNLKGTIVAPIVTHGHQHPLLPPGLERKLRLEAAMAAWKAKGNSRLAEACAVALEADQARNLPPKAA